MKELIISFNDCCFGYTKNRIFENIFRNINKGDKVALVGKNGAGKTSLMKLISKEKQFDEGESWFHPHLLIGYLNQKENFVYNSSTRDFLKQFCGINSDQEFKIESFCQELKIDLNLTFDNLSGGQRKKVFLINLLVKDPNLLLLDEPTNHLDIESILWLENYLNKKFKGSFIIVSHDRKFLENTTNKVFWIDRRKIKISPKGFYNFETWSSKLIEHERKTLKNKGNFLKQELEWISKGIKARRKRNIRRKNLAKNLEITFKKDHKEFLKSISKVKFQKIDEDEDLGPNVIAQFFNVTKSYNENILFDKFDFKLVRGEKIGLIGKNGTGKSTFFKLLTGEIQPENGSVKFKNSINYSYFDQLGGQFDDKKSIKENLVPGGGDFIEVNGIKKHICGYIKNFLFLPDEVNNLVSTLSGGQRNRLLLAKILAKPNKLMILDEPTNDLDSETLEILVDYINDYRGTVLISSHDRKFLDETTDKVFYFSGKGDIKLHLGLCSEIISKIDEVKQSNSNDKSNNKQKFNKINYNKEIEKILKKMSKIEDKLNEAKFMLQDKNLFKNNKLKFDEVVNNISKYEQDLSYLEKKWIKLEEESLTYHS